jgi:LD-carboxypeptidase C-terminal domain
VHLRSLRAALLTGERLEVTEPGESEDFGKDWRDPAALTQHGDRESTEPWTWAGPTRSVTGRTWGGCAEVVQWVLTAGRFPTDPAVLQGGVLLLETSEELISAREFGWIVRSLGERGLLEAVDAVLVARPPTSSLEVHPTSQQRAAHRAEQRDVAIDTVTGTTRRHRACRSALRAHPPPMDPSVGGQVTVDGTAQKVWADYS